MCSQSFYHLANISTFQHTYSQFTYSVSDVIRIRSALRSDHEGHPYSGGDPGMHPAATQENSTGPGLSTVFGQEE